MLRLRGLAALFLLAGLGGCASPQDGAGLHTSQAAPPAGPTGVDDKASPYGLYLAGQVALRQGDSEGAANYFVKAAQEGSDTGFIKIRAFQTALLSGDVSRAADLAPAAGEGSAADEMLGRFTRAVEALAEGRGGQAEALLTGGPLAPPLDTAAKLLLPWAAAADGDWKTAFTLPDSGGDHLIGQISLLDHALLLENRGRIDEADQAFRALLAQSDGAGLYTTAYGEFLERHGRASIAINLYRAALKADAGNTLVQDTLSRALAKRPPPRAPTFAEGAGGALLVPAALLLAEKQPGLGLDYLRLVLRLDPTRDEAWLLVGDTLAAKGQVEAARQAYAKPQPGSPNYIAARSRLIGTYDKPSDAVTELQLAEETAKAAPDDPEAMALLADALRNNDRYAESAAVLDHLITQQGANAGWNLYYMRGVAYDLAGDWTSAERDLKKALELSPDEPDVLNYLGYTWIDRGVDVEAAKTMIERAVAAKPDSGAIVDSLGWAYYRLGQYAQAVEQLERATELEPADPDINNHLGDAYWRAGRKLEARFQWEQVLTLTPSDKLRIEVVEKLKSGLDANPRPAIAER